MEKVFVRSEYNYDRDKASDESGLRCEDLSLTKQSFAEECDINTIVRRFGVTGELPQSVVMPTYQDFEGIFDFQSAMNSIVQSNDSFMQMPAEVRARFNNDPALFVDFCSNSDNLEEAIKLGLVVKKKQDAPEGAHKDGGEAPPAQVPT